MDKRDSCPQPYALAPLGSSVSLYGVRNLWAQENIPTWVQITSSKPAQGTRTLGFLPVVLRAQVDSTPGSVHLRVDHDTSLRIFRSQGQPLVGCGWNVGMVSTFVCTGPLWCMCVGQG